MEDLTLESALKQADEHAKRINSTVNFEAIRLDPKTGVISPDDVSAIQSGGSAHDGE